MVYQAFFLCNLHIRNSCKLAKLLLKVCLHITGANSYGLPVSLTDDLTGYLGFLWETAHICQLVLQIIDHQLKTYLKDG